MLVTHEVASLVVAVGACKFRLALARRRQVIAVFVACLTGSLLPDLFRGTAIVVNKFLGLPPEDNIPKIIDGITFVLHNFWLWLGIFLATLLVSKHGKPSNSFRMACAKLFSFSALVLHICLDLISHTKGRRFYGGNYLWPLPLRVTKRFGLFYYRRDSLNLLISQTELFLCLCLAALAIALLLWEKRADTGRGLNLAASRPEP